MPRSFSAGRARKRKKGKDDMIALKSTAIAASLLFSSAALAAEAKITVLYAQPNSAEEFDKH